MQPAEEADIEIMMWKEPEGQRDDQRRPIFKPNSIIGVDVAEGL